MYSVAGEGWPQADAAVWARFVGAPDDLAFYRSWLGLAVPGLGRVRGAVLLLPGDDGVSYSVAATWPDDSADLKYLSPAAQQALGQGDGIIITRLDGLPLLDGHAHVGQAFDVDGRTCAIIAVDLAAGSPPASALRQLQWAGAWIQDRVRRRIVDDARADAARAGLLNGLMATALQQRRCRASSMAVANELVACLCCDRVAIGFEHNDGIVPLAISHTATFDPRSDLVRALGAAMDEVLDLGTVVVLPRPAGDELGAVAHEQAAQALGARVMLSVPLVHEARTVGVMTFERHQGPDFSANDRRIAQAAGLLLGPAWALQRLNERSWRARLLSQWRDGLQTMLGPRHPGLKLGSALAGLALLALALWPADFRVAARTVIEGSTQRARVAPFDGFIAEALVRAGDTVRDGQPMARLDDRDLKLERARWTAELEQAQRKFQVALAQADRGAMGVLGAQSLQAEAQLGLVDEKLARTQITAPFDGVVVSGDLSQSVGTPVEQGRTLFEVAPLAGFRVVLQVDDRDIAHVAVGQTGELVLSSLPDRSVAFRVSSITSVATQHDGRNVFRVEAQVPLTQLRLRPGMEGIGKISVSQRSLLWIWTHNAVDGLRVALWSWLP